MGFTIYRLVSLGIFLTCWTDFGSSLRVVQNPQPFTFSTEELNISCIVDDPSYMTKSILSIQIMRHIEDKAIAVISEAGILKTAVGIKDNVKAKGHIDTKSKKGYLSLIIDKPHRQDAGTYRCQMFVMDEDFQLVEKNVIGNVTYQESDIAGVVTHLTRQLTSLLTRFNNQNITLQTLQKQHTAFKHFHSGQKLDMDILIDKIDTQNITITQQNKQLEHLRDYNSQQKLDMDNLIGKIDTQNITIAQQNKQLEHLRDYKSDMDILIDKIDKQNITNIHQNMRLEDFREFHSQQKLDVDSLTNEVDRQNNTDMKIIKQIENQNSEINKQDAQNDKQTKQIERLNALVDKLNTDNTQKQQQLDTLLDYIQRLNKTNREHEIELEKINKRVLGLGPGWKHYDADNTFIKVFGKDDSSKRLSWPKARESCQSFGGDLVVIRDAQKNNFVYNLFGSGYTAWIGVRNAARRGFDFKYVDGSDMGSYHPWNGSNPHGDEDSDDKCVDMFTHPSYPGQWLDYTCYYKRSYVCSVSSINDL